MCPCTPKSIIESRQSNVKKKEHFFLALERNRKIDIIRKRKHNFGEDIQYRFKTDDGEDKIVKPDASINCRIKARRGNFFIDAPRFVMEVLSESTEKYDRGEKTELYRQQEADEFWIGDLRKKQVEIYNLDYDENGQPAFYPGDVITEANKKRAVCRGGYGLYLTDRRNYGDKAVHGTPCPPQSLFQIPSRFHLHPVRIPGIILQRDILHIDNLH